MTHRPRPSAQRGPRAPGRRVYRSAVGGLLLIALAGGPAASPAAAGAIPTTILVDDDGRAGAHGCAGGAAGSAPRTIGAAVTGARPGTTIRVCPGRYPPVAVVGRPRIAIEATVPWRATIVTARGEGPVHAGIHVADADGTRISGLRILHRARDPERGIGRCRALAAGVHVHGSRGVVLRALRVRAVGPGTLDPRCGMTFGIVAGIPAFLVPSAGAPDLPGTEPGASLATDVTVAWSLVADHRLGGIVATSTVLGTGAEVRTGPTRVLLLRDSVRFFHPAAPACDGPAGVAPAADRARPTGAGALRRAIAAVLPAGVACLQDAVGVYLGAGVADSPVAGAAGRIDGVRVLSAGSGMGDGGDDPRGAAVQLAGIALVDPAHRPGAARVVRSRVAGSLVGIVAVDAAGARIAGSHATGGLVGIHVADTVGGTVAANVATGNDAGIVVTDALLSVADAPRGDGVLRTARIVVQGNDARGNRTVACADETVGEGTRGTANTWWGNVGGRAEVRPAGICAVRLRASGAAPR